MEENEGNKQEEVSEQEGGTEEEPQVYSVKKGAHGMEIQPARVSGRSSHSSRSSNSHGHGRKGRI